MRFTVVALVAAVAAVAFVNTVQGSAIERLQAQIAEAQENAAELIAEAEAVTASDAESDGAAQFLELFAQVEDEPAQAAEDEPAQAAEDEPAQAAAPPKDKNKKNRKGKGKKDKKPKGEKKPDKKDKKGRKSKVAKKDKKKSKKSAKDKKNKFQVDKNGKLVPKGGKKKGNLKALAKAQKAEMLKNTVYIDGVEFKRFEDGSMMRVYRTGKKIGKNGWPKKDKKPKKDTKQAPPKQDTKKSGKDTKKAPPKQETKKTGKGKSY